VPTGPFRFVGLIGAMTGNRNVRESELRVDYPKGGQVSLTLSGHRPVDKLLALADEVIE
jgi:hypothetical protein